jgi:hypothetical protein
MADGGLGSILAPSAPTRVVRIGRIRSVGSFSRLPAGGLGPPASWPTERRGTRGSGFDRRAGGGSGASNLTARFRAAAQPPAVRRRGARGSPRPTCAAPPPRAAGCSTGGAARVGVEQVQARHHQQSGDGEAPVPAASGGCG